MGAYAQYDFEPIKYWKCTICVPKRRGLDYCTIYVKAATKQEAEAIAKQRAWKIAPGAFVGYVMQEVEI